MNLIKSYDENGNKVLSEGVTHAEIESLKLPDLGEPTVQDRMIDLLKRSLEEIARVNPKPFYKTSQVELDILSLLASLEGEK